MKIFFTSLFILLLIDNLYAQTNDSTNFDLQPTLVDEVVRQLGSDTLVFYYNNNWQLVRPICATIFRVSRVDAVLATFTGEFIDYYSSDSTKVTEGNYSKGKKEGKFNIYFPNGQLDQTGSYFNNTKRGVWDYYYENGTKRQVLEFRDNEVYIKEFWDEDGKKLIESGNGEWFGYSSSQKFSKTYGEIINGRQNGTWKKTIVSRNFTTNIEKYNNGKFVSGKMFSLLGGDETYKDTSYCSVEINPLFLNAEQFLMNRCFKEEKNIWEFAEYPGGMKRFYSEISEKIVLSSPVIKQGIIKVQTTIDIEGKMTNFKPISDTGYEFDLIQVLQNMGNWIPTKINGKPTIQPKIINFEIR